MQKITSVAFASSLALVAVLGIDLPLGDDGSTGGGYHTHNHSWCC